MPIGIPPPPLPRAEGTVPLPDGRRLGYAEFGQRDGPLLLWCHGTPGARRQVPPAARRAADKLGVRIVCVERPGVGVSTDHTYPDVRGWAADIGLVADHLGHERFMVAGLSGGGPYALACAHELPERVAAVGLLGSVVPTAGEEAAQRGIVGVLRPLNGVLSALRRPLGLGMWAFITAANPVAAAVYGAYARVTTEGDRRVLNDPELRAIFIDDLVGGAARQFQAFHNDLLLIGRHWGFRVADIQAPVRWWHGDKDPFVPLAQAQQTAGLLRDVEFHVRPDESHLGGFAAGDEVVIALHALWDRGSQVRPLR